MKKTFSPFDYTLTISRKYKYLVINSPEFGYQVASGCVDLRSASPESIGKAVLQVLENLNQRLLEMERDGDTVPRPRKSLATLGDETVSASEATRILGVSRPTLRRMVYETRLPCNRTPGGHMRFSLNALSDYLVGESTAA